MTTPVGRKNTLIRGIAHSLGRSHGTVGIAKSANMNSLDEIARWPETIKAIQADAQAAKNEVIKVLSDSGSEDPIGQADAIIAAVQSGQSVRKFLAGADNASPGQRPGIIHATDYAPGNRSYGRQAPGQATVHGQEDEPTPDAPFNQGIADRVAERRWAYEAGHERYGSAGAGGTGEDQARSRTTTSPTRYRGLGQLGGQQPPHPTASPGRSGNYGTGSRIETRKHVHPTATLFEKGQRDVADNPELSGYFDRAINRTRSDRMPQRLTKDAIQREADFEVRREDGEFSKLDDEELSRVKRLLEEEERYRDLARRAETEEDHLEFEAKANASAQLRKQLATKLSIETGLSAQTLTKSIVRGRFYSTKLEK